MDFTEQSLRTTLEGKSVGAPLYFFPVTESTNFQAAKMADEGAPEGTVVIADCQTGGRGRMKREWFSPPGMNLYASLILRPGFPAALASPLTIMAGVAVAGALDHYCPGRVQLKWPNDALVGSKKISGILTEIKTFGRQVEFVVLGIGVNINMRKGDFGFPLEQTATSLREETGSHISRLEVAGRIFAEIGRYYQLLSQEGMAAIREKWLAYSGLAGKYVEITFGGEISGGTVTGIDETGALIIRPKSGGERRIIAGDVAVIER